MATTDTKAIVRRYYDEVINQKNMALIDELFGADLVFRDPAVPHPIQGPEGLKQFLTAFGSAFPDLQFQVEDLFGEDDKVAARITAAGTHTGELMGIPATGKQVTIFLTEIFHFVGSQITDVWVSFDMLNFMQQLGTIPVPA